MGNNAPMLKSARSEHYEENRPRSGGGCSCCNPSGLRRNWKKAAKRKEERAWRRDVERDL